MIKFELKKIFNIKIVLVIFVLTALFYNMFLSTNYFATSNMGAEDKLCTILMKDYGTKLRLTILYRCRKKWRMTKIFLKSKT